MVTQGRKGHESLGKREGYEYHEGIGNRENRKNRGRQEGHAHHEGRGDHENRESRGKHKDYGHHEDSGDHRGRGGRPERKGYRALVEKPGTHLLFIGSNSCTRHKGTVKLELQREGKLTFLILDEVDWITGGYLNHIEEAAREIAEEIHPQHLVLFGGCQIELLSTDYETMTQNLSKELGIEVRFHKGCHLVGYDPDAAE